MAEKKGSSWDRIFNLNHNSEREEKVLAYIAHRLADGATLEDIVQEQYARRNASPAEIEDILDNPILVEATREKMEEDFEELVRASRARGRDRGRRSWND
jgi:hypothetical protein